MNIRVTRPYTRSPNLRHISTLKNNLEDSVPDKYLNLEFILTEEIVQYILRCITGRRTKSAYTGTHDRNSHEALFSTYFCIAISFPF